MSVDQINITIGTAGHVDHGKTALVRCFTGCETDRLKEEQERGMSIELGFAPCTVAGLQLGIVDVPGHEDFVKTMVAGAGGMDGVILVVAADDGVMPQTREHLDILTLLGIRHGLVALTKIDRVDAEHREIARLDVADFVRGTFLEGAPIVPLSNTTGEGFEQFYEALAALVRSIRPKPADGVFRLPVERAFSVPGYGTVVAGIPLAGFARTGQEVVLLPGGATGRIRRIEVYGRTSDIVLAGQCAAINLGHWDHHAIHRGNTVATPGYFVPHEWYAASLRLLPRARLALKNGSEVRFHTGTSEVNAAVYAVQGTRMEGGHDYLVQIRTAAPVVAGPGDRFVVRRLSPVETIGGGMILEATAGRLKRNRPQVAQDLSERALAVPDDRRFVEYCLRNSPARAAAPAELAARAKLPQDRLGAILAELVGQQKAVLLGPGLYIHHDTVEDCAASMLRKIEEFHRRFPESPGIPPEELRQSYGLEKPVLEGLVGLLVGQGRLARRSGRLASPRHQATFSDEDRRRLEKIEAAYSQAAFSPPSPDELAARTGEPPAAVRKAVGILQQHGGLVQVEDLWFHRDAVARARELLVAHLHREGRLESVDFKYLLGTTRKFALPLLDYFDRIGVTRRAGNTRFLGTAKE
ncbi:MAG: selenocysteine-specific translation elongation factor [Thermoguttaceae bacterium]|jgi:selenocysteine-specific elongation factor